ncbi:MAG TPA: GTP-sensing pleiotropic transcriptional regulator CodY [Firmicutes bacterium]|nr:GTP-sensing pleiotropic transcriptional regulator CodY [Candidatus Fermentithermobacillaceae bacterium]
METLLDKTRRMNQLLSGAASEVDFHGSARVIRDVVECNVYILDKSGKVLGYALMDDFDCRVMKEDVLESQGFPPSYNERLHMYREPVVNLRSDGGVCVFKEGTPCEYAQKITTILPVMGGGERLGTLVLARMDKEFSDEDLILAEHAATVTAMEILRYNQEKVEEETRQRTAVQVALGTLSFSELNAMRHIFEELGGTEGFLVASKVADRVGITRSVIVNALRKFESAGVIESRSLGMKGTFIRVLNPKLLEELKKLR